MATSWRSRVVVACSTARARRSAGASASRAAATEECGLVLGLGPERDLGGGGRIAADQPAEEGVGRFGHGANIELGADGGLMGS